MFIKVQTQQNKCQLTGQHKNTNTTQTEFKYTKKNIKYNNKYNNNNSVLVY
jgi:hypothetical protein